MTVNTEDTLFIISIVTLFLGIFFGLIFFIPFLILVAIQFVRYHWE